MVTVEVVLVDGSREGDHRTVGIDDSGVPPAEIRVTQPAVRAGPDGGERPWVYVYRRCEQRSGVWRYLFDRRRLLVQERVEQFGPWVDAGTRGQPPEHGRRALTRG